MNAAYTVPAIMGNTDTAAAAIATDSPVTMHLLFDAMRAACEFHAQTLRNRPTHSDDGHEYSILGQRQFWGRTEVEDTLTPVFGEDAIKRVADLIARYRDVGLDAVDDGFMLAMSILLHRGATMGDFMMWDMHISHDGSGPTTENNRGLGYLCPAYWLAAWGKESLNALLTAGYTYSELADIYASKTLPDPTVVSVMAGLRVNA